MKNRTGIFVWCAVFALLVALDVRLYVINGEIGQHAFYASLLLCFPCGWIPILIGGALLSLLQYFLPSTSDAISGSGSIVVGVALWVIAFFAFVFGYWQWFIWLPRRLSKAT